MLSTVSLTLMTLAWLGLANALIVHKRGECPNVPGQATLDTAQYLGEWYEYQSFPSIFEAGLRCITVTYGQDGDKISVTNKGTPRSDFFWNKRSISGSATVPDPAKPAELSVSLGRVDMESSSPNYIIVDTDYTNYAVVFSCAQFRRSQIQFAWILTREPGVAPSNLAALEDNLSALDVDVSNFRVVDQSDCPGR